MIRRHSGFTLIELLVVVKKKVTYVVSTSPYLSVFRALE